MFQDRIAELIKQAIGMDAGTTGPLSLANAIRARMTACGEREMQDYWMRLQRSGEELAQLIEMVVVPETWFFRAPEAFAALIQMVRNEWLPAHPAGRLRILSAPCSTGEEPYSIAMALMDAGLAASRFKIDAIDISVRALEQARRATYGRNSFRGAEVSFRERYFHNIPGGHELNDDVRGCVDFRKFNLVADEVLPGMGGYDAIFCRNVLIYFDTPTQEQVVRNLGLLLAPAGVLFVGPSETFVTRSAGFSTVDFPGAFMCRKSGQKETPPAPVLKAFTAPPDLRGEFVRKPIPKTPPPRLTKPTASPPPVAAAVPPSTSKLEAATGLANAGRLPEAFSMCEAYLRENGLSADGFYLLGLIRDTQEDAQAAAGFYRKALYLDPGHQETLLHLAMLEEKLGNPAGARRLQLRAAGRDKDKEVIR